MYVIVYQKTIDMMCADTWHHSGDIKVGMQRQFNLELTKESKIN